MPSVCIFVFSDEISEIIISFRSDSSVSGRRFPVLIFILRLLQGAVFFRRAAFFGRETERNDSVLVLDIDFFAQKVKHL